MIKYPANVLILIAYFKKFPGIGSKTAERFVFDLLKWKESEVKNFSKVLEEFNTNLQYCQDCGCLMENRNCYFCSNARRNSDQICIISNPRDVFSIEQTNSYNGLYHVIETLLSPLDGFNVESICLENLEKKLEKNKTKEMIIALDSTLEGDATSLFLKNKFKDKNINISRLAFGIPMGSSLEYVNGGTLTKAFIGRQKY